MGHDHQLESGFARILIFETFGSGDHRVRRRAMS
jgi:hypothetical protein